MFAFIKRLKESFLLKRYLRDEKEIGPPTQATLVNRMLRAARADHPRIIKYCLNRGVSPDEKSEYRAEGYFRKDKFLGVELAYGLPSSEPALMLAIRRHSLAAAEVLLDRGADVNAPSVFGYPGWKESAYTPLYAAVCLQDVGLVWRLIDGGADPDAGMKKEQSGRRPLEEAIRRGNVRIVEALAECGAAGLEDAMHKVEEAGKRGMAKVLHEEYRKRAEAAEAAEAEGKAKLPPSITPALNAAAQPANDTPQALENPMKAMRPLTFNRGRRP